MLMPLFDHPTHTALARYVPALDAMEVLDSCHRATVAGLKQLHAIARVLKAGDPLDAAARERLADIVRFFEETSRQHHEDEERHVFPRLLPTADPELRATIERLSADHAWMDEDWRALAPRLSRLAAGDPPVDAGPLAGAMEAFVALSIGHIALEESCIYPQARAALDGDERHAMGREMVERHRAYHRRLRRRVA